MLESIQNVNQVLQKLLHNLKFDTNAELVK